MVNPRDWTNEEIRPMMMPRGIDRWFEENISWMVSV
jgi:hypothetical protein